MARLGTINRAQSSSILTVGAPGLEQNLGDLISSRHEKCIKNVVI